jgi:signal transduction histidine kinase
MGGPRYRAYFPDLEPVRDVMKGRELRVSSATHRNEGETGSSWRDHVSRLRMGVDPRAPEGRIWLTAGALTFVLLLSVIVTLTDNRAHFTIYSMTAEVGLESASALARLFAALVLFLFPWEKGANRLRWVAAGLAVLGMGGLIFGFIAPLFGVTLSFNSSTYASGAIRTLAGLLLAIGLVPRQSPNFSRRWALITAAGLIIITVAAIPLGDALPALAHVPSLRAAAGSQTTVLPGLTAWHWELSLVPMGLALAATVGAVRAVRDGTVEAWLLLAMLLLTGSQLYAMFWPSAYSPLVTTADLLRLAFALVILIGAIDQLRHRAAERAILLTDARDHAHRLTELGILKAHFTAMVAHELGNPLAAIRFATEMLSTGELTREEEANTVHSIRREAEVLTRLVSDVSTAAAVEQDDFQVRPRLVPLSGLIADAASYGKSLAGDHPIIAPFATVQMVWADPERIGQVLRNLVSNAAKYSPNGTPIEIRVSRQASLVHLEVSDGGYGIHPDDMVRVFDKFGRGRDQSGQKVEGIGLGLYLSRRIAQAHGTDLTIESTLGAGSTFGFDLEGIL